MTSTVSKALIRGVAGLLTVLGSGVIYVACSSCCVRAGSLVLTPDGLVPIESIEAGDVVLSWDFSSDQWVENRVEKTYRKVGFSWVKAVLPSGQTLEATADHQAYDAAHGGYVDVGHVQEFAFLDAANALSTAAPAERETAYGVATFHDLTLASEPRNYIANGVVVHNKTLGPYSKSATPGPIGGIAPAAGGTGTGPLSGISGGPISDIITPSGTGPTGPIGGIQGGPISGITGGAGGGSGGGGGGTTPPAGGTGNLALSAPFPNSGGPAGGDVFYLRGTGIETGISVQVGTRFATVLGSGNSTPGVGVDIIAVSSPAGISGNILNITITTPDGDTQTLLQAFTYTPTAQPQFKANTDKWYLATTAGNLLGDADQNGQSDLEEALAIAIGTSGAAGDFTNQANAFLSLMLSSTNQFYKNNADGSRSIGGIPISFMSDRYDNGVLIPFANGVLSPLPGLSFTPAFPGNFNIMAFRNAPDPFGSSGVVGQAISETLNTNTTIEGDTFFLNQNQVNGNELGIFTNSLVTFWNAAAIANTQRTLTELAEEYAATLAHEVGHSIGREHTDDAPTAPATVNIMSATSAFDIANVYAFDDARFNTMLGYMPGANRRTHAVAFSPRTLVRNADAVLIGTPHRLADGKLNVLWHETLFGPVDASGGQVAVGGFSPSVSAGPETLEPLGRCMFFLNSSAGGWVLRDVNAVLGLDSAHGPELDLVIRDYLALAQLSGSAHSQAYCERVAASLRSDSAYLRTATLVELSLDQASCRGLSAAQLAPLQALLTSADARVEDRILAGQFFVHRADAALAGELLQAALATDDPILLKTLAGSLETSLGLVKAASRVRDQLIRLDAAGLARARVLLGWLRADSAVEFVVEGLSDEAQACAAADALGRIGSERALAPLQGTASDTSRPTPVRHCALRAIGQIGGDAARAWLTRRWEGMAPGLERDAVRYARDFPSTWQVR